MSVVIASSLGLPSREHETLIVNASTKTRTLILFLRISSSALAASKQSGGLGQPEMAYLPHALVCKTAFIGTDAAVGQTAASIRILLELAQECNSAVPSLPKSALRKKK